LWHPPARREGGDGPGRIYCASMPWSFALLRNTFMLFVYTFDAIFKFAPIVWKLFSHFVGPKPGTLRLMAGLSITVSPTRNL
jgi:hypothetical protein